MLFCTLILLQVGDVDSTVYKIDQSEAYILGTLSPGNEGRLFHIIVDSMFMFTCENLKNALVNIMCYYYVLDLSYPKVMYALLIFIQHFIFGVTDTGRVPTSVINLCSKF